MKRLILALEDIATAFRQYRVWLHLGLMEVKQRYRRSVLGPWWISISMLIFIAAMGKIYSRLFSQNLNEYIPFFTAGFLLWSFISTSVMESTDLFRMHSGFIKQVKLPYNIYTLKFLTKNFVVLLHNLVVYLLIVWFFQINPGWNVLLAIPGFLLLAVNMYWICLFTALMSTRFRDMVPIVNSCMQILFFITPVSWMPKLLGENSIVVKLNPFAYFIDIVRQPLLGFAPASEIWVVNIFIAIAGLSIAIGVFSTARTRIPFWVD